MDKKEMVVTTTITLVQTIPIDTLDEHDASDAREAEYIEEVKEYMEAAVEEENTVVTVEVTRLER